MANKIPNTQVLVILETDKNTAYVTTTLQYYDQLKLFFFICYRFCIFFCLHNYTSRKSFAQQLDDWTFGVWEQPAAWPLTTRLI